MKPNRKVYIVGGELTTFIGKNHPDFVWKKHPDFGKRENPTLEEMTSTAINGALTKTGVKADQIQRGYVGNFAGELFSNQGHMGALAVRAHKDLSGVPFIRVEGACASGGLALVGAIESIQAGLDVVMAMGRSPNDRLGPRWRRLLGPRLPLGDRARDRRVHLPRHVRASQQDLQRGL